MNKEQFLDDLCERLGRLAPEERERVLDFYRELIEDRLEAGESEDAVLGGFGSPDALAGRILAESQSESAGEHEPAEKAASAQKGVPAEGMPEREGMSRGLRNTLLILGSPIWLSLLIAAAAVALTLAIAALILYLAGWIIIGSFNIAGIALMLMLPAGVVMSLPLFPSLPAKAIFQIGLGVFCAGLGLLFFLGTQRLARLWLRWTNQLVRRVTSIRWRKGSNTHA